MVDGFSKTEGPPNSLASSRMLVHAVAELCSVRRERNELHRYAECQGEGGNDLRSLEDLSPQGRGVVEMVQTLSSHPDLVREYLQARIKVQEARDQLGRALRYPLLILVLAACSLSIFGWANHLVERALTPDFDQMVTYNWTRVPSVPIPLGMQVVRQCIPILFGTLVAIGVTVRVVGGPLIASQIIGRIPWFGALRRFQSSAELLRLVSLLLRAEVRLDKAFELAGMASAHRTNAPLGQAIASELRKGKSLVAILAGRSWFPSWLVDYYHRASLTNPVEKTLSDSAALLDIHASGNSRTLLRVLPQLIFCGLILLLQFGYVTLILKFIEAINNLS